MKILRLSPQDARTWRENRAVLIDKDGNLVRPIEFFEMKALNDLQKKCRQMRQEGSAEIKRDTPEGEVTTKIAITTKRVAKTTVMVSWVDDCEVIDGREFFRREVLKEHGECQLRSHLGQFMHAIRDPNIVRPSAKESANRYAPRPEHCQCREWGNPHPGRHHQVCEWNLRAPLEERAVAEDDVPVRLAEERLMPERMTVTEKPSLLKRAHVPSMNVHQLTGVVGSGPVIDPVSRSNVPDPNECVCKDFPMPGGGSRMPGVHHPVCEFYEAWQAQNLPKMMLVSLETGVAVRRATAEEVKEAQGDRAYVTIGGEQYGVVPEDEVSTSAAE